MKACYPPSLRVYIYICLIIMLNLKIATKLGDEKHLCSTSKKVLKIESKESAMFSSPLFNVCRIASIRPTRRLGSKVFSKCRVRVLMCGFPIAACRSRDWQTGFVIFVMIKIGENGWLMDGENGYVIFADFHRNGDSWMVFVRENPHMDENYDFGSPQMYVSMLRLSLVMSSPIHR